MDSNTEKVNEEETIKLIKKRSSNKVRFSESITSIEVLSYKNFNKTNTAEPILEKEEGKCPCVSCIIY